MKYLPLLLLPVLAFFFSCQPAGPDRQPAAEAGPDNPPAPGFNLAASDPEAVILADSVMGAMGGRQAWDKTRYLYWNFFGRRSLLWDKHQERVRISMQSDSTIYLLDLADKTGKVLQEGKVIENQDSLAFYLDRAESIWINDSYWLVMPFKLKDSGVTLRYLGQDTTQLGEAAEVLQLTFEDIGKTPENKYHVLVDPASYHVVEWRYFSQASDEQPAIVTPWRDYRQHGAILLSGDRGTRQLTDIAVFTQVPESAFTELKPLDPDSLR